MRVSPARTRTPAPHPVDFAGRLDDLLDENGLRPNGSAGSPDAGQAFRAAATDSRPSSATETCRISTFLILPVTVIGKSSTILT